MTKKEALRWLKDFKNCSWDGMPEEVLDVAIEALEQEPEPVYFPPCVDCQNRSKAILTAYNNMKKMQTYTKEEVITMFDKIRVDIKHHSEHFINDDGEDCLALYEDDVIEILDKYRVESEGNG